MRARYVSIGITAAVGVGLGFGLSHLPLHPGASSTHRSASLQVDADVREAGRVYKIATPPHGVAATAPASYRAAPTARAPRGAGAVAGVVVVAPGAVKLSPAPPVDGPPSTNAVPLPTPPSAGEEQDRLVALPPLAAPSVSEGRDRLVALSAPSTKLPAVRPHIVASPLASSTRAAPPAGRAGLAPPSSYKASATVKATATSLSATATVAPPSATATLVPTATALAAVSVTPALTATKPLTAPSLSAATVLTGTAAAAALKRDPAAATAEQARVTALTTKPVQRSYISYVVQPGDTVESIAKRFHDVAWLIRRRNGGLWTMAPGQTILVWRWPFDAPSYALVPEDLPQTYAVKAGDTLSAIATTLRTDVATLVSENGLADGGSFLSVGQALTLHHYSATAKQRVFVPGVSADRLSTGLLLTDLPNVVGTDAALVKGLVWHETGWTMVRGASGEIGMVQIMPYMSSWVEKTLVGYALDPYTRADNILEGTLLLQYYLDATRGDVHKSLALYHSGNMLADPRNGDYLRAILALRDYYYHNPRAGF